MNPQIYFCPGTARVLGVGVVLGGGTGDWDGNHTASNMCSIILFPYSNLNKYKNKHFFECGFNYRILFGFSHGIMTVDSSCMFHLPQSFRHRH